VRDLDGWDTFLVLTAIDYQNSCCLGDLDTSGWWSLLRWTDCTKKDLKQASIPTEEWLELAQDPVHWKSLIKDGLGKWETDSMKKPSLLITGEGASGVFPCSNDGCGRQFLSHRGLAQHIRQKHRPVSALVPSTSVATAAPVVLRCTFVGCDRQFSSQCGLAQHIRQRHHLTSGPPLPATAGGNASGPFLCSRDGCNRQFSSHRGLAQHIRQKHTIPPSAADAAGDVNSSSTPLLTCGFCGRVCRNRSGLTRHVQHCVAAHNRMVFFQPLSRRFLVRETWALFLS